MLGRGRGIYDIAVRKHDFHLKHHVVDLAVLGADYAYTAMSQKSSHCRTGQRAGIVHSGIALFVCGPLDVLVYCARSALYIHAFRIDLIDLVHALGIDDNAAGNGNRSALSAAASAPCGNGYLIVVGDFQHLAGFLRIKRTNHHVSLGHALAAVRPHTRQPEIIHAVRDLVNLAHRTVFPADRILKLAHYIGEQKFVK